MTIRREHRFFSRDLSDLQEALPAATLGACRGDRMKTVARSAKPSLCTSHQLRPPSLETFPERAPSLWA